MDALFPVVTGERGGGDDWHLVDGHHQRARQIITQGVLVRRRMTREAPPSQALEELRCVVHLRQEQQQQTKHTALYTTSTDNQCSISSCGIQCQIQDCGSGLLAHNA